MTTTINTGIKKVSVNEVGPFNIPNGFYNFFKEAVKFIRGLYFGLSGLLILK